MRRFSIAMADGDISLCSWMAGAAPTGDKPVLHWAHANGFNGETYTPLLEPLQARFDICAWDSRGHGLTSLPANPEEMTGWHIYRDDLIGVIEHLAQAAGQKIWLGGHSMGGCASIMAAAQRPDLVAGLVLTDPVIVPSTGLNLMRLWYRLRPHSGTILMQMAGKRRAVWPDIETITAAYTGRGAFATWQDGFLDAYLRGGLLPHEDDAGNRLETGLRAGMGSGQFQRPARSLCAADKKTASAVHLADGRNRLNHPRGGRFSCAEAAQKNRYCAGQHTFSANGVSRIGARGYLPPNRSQTDLGAICVLPRILSRLG